jgi:predicted Zn-dependent peptidase
VNIFGSKNNPALESFDNPIFSSTNQPIYTDRKVSTSRLENGVTILTETSSLPSKVNMGILLNVGTRDENKKTSGACHSIQTTYYKSFAFTNETINYGMVQMTGGDFRMNFNRENIWYNSSCLGHDVIDIFNMMADCALEPRNFNSVSAAIAKLPHSLKAKHASFGWDDFNDLVF